jgi:hypothetical protein
VIPRLVKEHHLTNWRRLHAVCLNVAIAMYALDLPPYTLLEIVDWLPHFHLAKRGDKIKLLIDVKRSCDAVMQRRRARQIDLCSPMSKLSFSDIVVDSKTNDSSSHDSKFSVVL